MHIVGTADYNISAISAILCQLCNDANGKDLTYFPTGFHQHFGVGRTSKRRILKKHPQLRTIFAAAFSNFQESFELIKFLIFIQEFRNCHLSPRCGGP